MSDQKSGHALAGLAVIGTAITGVLSLLLAVLTTLDGRLEATGLCLLAAAVAFGLLGRTVFGD